MTFKLLTHGSFLVVHLYGSSELCGFCESRNFNGYDSFATHLYWTGLGGEVCFAHRGADRRVWKKSGGRPDRPKVFLGAHRRTVCREASASEFESALNKCNSGSSSFVDVLIPRIMASRILFCPSVLDMAFPLLFVGVKRFRGAEVLLQPRFQLSGRNIFTVGATMLQVRLKFFFGLAFSQRIPRHQRNMKCAVNTRKNSCAGVVLSSGKMFPEVGECMVKKLTAPSAAKIKAVAPPDGEIITVGPKTLPLRGSVFSADLLFIVDAWTPASRRICSS